MHRDRERREPRRPAQPTRPHRGGEPLRDRAAERSVVVLTPANSGSSSRLRYVNDDRMPRSSSDARPMSTTTPSASSVGGAEGGVDDEGRTVQPLRRTEHLAGEAVGDHHVIADRHRIGHASLQSIVWHSPGDEPSAMAAMTAGRSRQDDSPVSSTSNAGSAADRARAAGGRPWFGCHDDAGRPCRPGSSGSSGAANGTRRRAEDSRLDRRTSWPR